MIISGVCFCIEAALIAFPLQIIKNGLQNVGIISGRIIAGVGMGFGTQAIPMYLSEPAPTYFRGGSNFMFQLATSLGILTANIVVDKQWEWNNYKVHGISFGLLAFLALLMLVGARFLSETPNSLTQRRSNEKGQKVLKKLRGTEDRKNRPQLVMAILMPMFQTLTGISSLLYYASILLLNMGFREKASLYSSVMIGAVLVSLALLSKAIVDRLGRRALLPSGGVVMITCQVGKLRDQQLSRSLSIVGLVLICLFASFRMVMGPPWGDNTKSAGQSITVTANLLSTLVVTKSFLPLLCALGFELFLFYASWITAMTICVYLFLPETKGVRAIEEMTSVWRNHRFRKKNVPAQLGA
ncbi:Sugar/inositol transporter [Parasponia andersonii]|uniref:Sugar/inositol transporter n=1 Tax=Parasponia andersonii TaxID=3476 RepID=A0A2P5D1D7_PARAD|nr:Sugar/inositol transporter [Parasponia andersonii]